MDRAAWLPVVRTRAHPADLEAGRWVLGVVSPILGLLLAGILHSFGVPWLFGVLPPVLFGLLCASLLCLHPRFSGGRDDRVFGDLGPRDEDMTEVRMDLYRGSDLLGTDQGYLWNEEGAICFQGGRVAFRVGGPAWRVKWWDIGKTEIAGPVRERIVFVRLGRVSGDAGVPPSTLGEGGTITPPPLDHDPAMRPPSLGWRVPGSALVIGAWIWGTSRHTADYVPQSVLWCFVNSCLLLALLIPVVRDRRGRRG